MGNDAIRASLKPWTDLMKYPYGSWHITTHETGNDSPDLIEKEIHVRQHAMPSGEQRSLGRDQMPSS